MSAKHPLRTWRQRNGLTAEQVGEQIGVTGNAVISYELGRRRPRWPILAKIVDVTGGELNANHFMPDGGDDEGVAA